MNKTKVQLCFINFIDVSLSGLNFAGFHGVDEAGSMNGNGNQLFRLELTTMTWEWLHPTGNQPVPCDKLAGWVYNDK
jgi:hypothetical protein